MARPAIIVNEEKVRELAAKGRKRKEIAAIVGISARTLKRRFDHAYKTGRHLMRGAIREAKLEVALGTGKRPKRNPLMLMYLGKTECGQREKQIQEIRVKKTERMVFGIEQSKIDALCNGYQQQPQLPQQAEAIDVEKVAESRSNEAHVSEQKG